MEQLWQDLRYGARMLRKAPGFTAIAVLTLALGIGANTAIFSVVNGVLLRPLPYPESGQLVRVFSAWPTQPHFPMAIADYKDYRDQNKVFAETALYAERDLDLTVADRPEHLAGMGVSHAYFRVLGYHVALGRDFQPNEENKGDNHVAILSDRLWRSHFAADPNIVGKSLNLSGDSFTVIGVMPPGVQHVGGEYQSLPHGDTVDVWWPLALNPPGKFDRAAHYLNMVARLKPGISVEQAGADMNSIAATLERDYPGSNRDGRISLVPLKEEIVGRARLMLLVLLGAVGFLLLIACVNVANLSLSRATARHREIALRSVLGAGRFRLVRQLFTESLLLAFLGCILGLMFSRWGVDALVALSPEKLPRLQEVHINAGVLAFAALSTVLTATIFGLAPALATLRSDINKSLKDGDRGATPGGSRARLRHWLVATEVALSVVLLAGAGLLMRTFVNLQHVNAGFQPSQVLTFRTNLPIKRYPDDFSFIRFYQSLLARLQILPGVQSVGDSSDIPWTGYDANTDFQIEGRATDPNHSPEATYHFASPDYFRAIGTPLLSGRFFTPADTADAPKVFMINSALARRYFPGEDPVGKRLGMWGFKGITIVGVVGDVKETPDAQQAKPSLYWCDSQFDDHGERVVVMRTNAGPSVAASAIQREVFALDKDLPITDVKMMDEIGAHAISNARFTLLLVGAFAGLAVLLAAIGIFGVMAYSVTQRTHEIGVRMALGAQQQDVLGMVVGQGAKLAATGVASGLIAALFLTRVMVSLLYGVSAYDPWTFACVAALLIVVALVACYLPARRAARVDPMIALRHE